MTSKQTRLTSAGLKILAELEKKVLWLSSWTIHHANHIRENADGLKVGGHQASSASLATIMTVLYFRTLRPQDRVAVKPHASVLPLSEFASPGRFSVRPCVRRMRAARSASLRAASCC